MAMEGSVMFNRNWIAPSILAGAIALTFSSLVVTAQVVNPGVQYVGTPAANNDCIKASVSGGNFQGITTAGSGCAATVNSANPSATAGPSAINGSAATYMRSDAAPAIQKGSAAQFGIVECDNVTITCPGGVLSGQNLSPANPSATAGPSAINGSAATYMRSDAAPAIQKGSNAQFGIVEGDGTTITCILGVCSTTGASAGVNSFDGLTGAVKGNSALGSVEIYWNGSNWVDQAPDGTFISTGSSTTNGIQEAINYAVSNNISNINFWGQGTAHACNTTTQISFTAYYGISFHGYGVNCNLITGAGATNGIVFDTQRYGTFYCRGCLWHYKGTGTAFVIQPSTGPGGISCTSNDTACWAADQSYFFGQIFMDTASANACIYIDVSQANGSSQLLSSAWVNNSLDFTCEAQGNANYGLEFASPVNAFQVGGENQISFKNIEGFTTAGILVGASTSSNDGGLGTNHYTGNIAITGNTASERGIQDDAIGDIFDLTSLNCYQSVGSQINVRWDAHATGNTIRTGQVIGCGGGIEGGTTQTFAMQNYITGVWRTFTPVVACAGGTINSGTFLGRAGIPPSSKTINFNLDLTITTATGCTTGSGGELTATVPFTAESNANVGMAREIASSGNAYLMFMSSGGTSVAIVSSSNTCPDCVSGRHFAGNGSLESQ
jgi:hypothetical protein